MEATGTQPSCKHPTFVPCRRAAELLCLTPEGLRKQIREGRCPVRPWKRRSGSREFFLFDIEELMAVVRRDD